MCIMDFQNILDTFNLGLKVKEFSQSTKSAQDVANTLGCSLPQIAKSIVFKTQESPVLVVTSGSNKVDTFKVEQHIGTKIEKATPDYVFSETGFIVGGVAPVGHKKLFPILIDQDLMQYAEVWAAAGSSNAVFKLTPSQLVLITKGVVADVKLSS